jgi:hypothetical protein
MAESSSPVSALYAKIALLMFIFIGIIINIAEYGHGAKSVVHHHI